MPMTEFHYRNMADQREEVAEPTATAEHIGISNPMPRNNSCQTIATSNPHTSSNSQSERMKISIFGQELSVSLDSVDLRIKLPANSQPDDPKRLMRVIFHHPLLPSTQLQFHPESTSQAAKASDIQSFEKGIKTSLETPSIEEEPFSENGGLHLLNNLRTTLDERSFLRSMLATSWFQDNDEELGVQNDQDHNAESNRSASEYNPFILGGLDPDQGEFLEF